MFKKKLNLFSKVIVCFAFASFFIAVDAFYIEPNWIEVTRVKLENKALADLLEETRIVHITDWHIHNGLEQRHLKMIEKVNALEPDLIFVTGDFFDDLTQVKYAQEALSLLKPKIGMFGVPGNTDHISMDSRSLANKLEPYGIRILINESVRVPLPSGKVLQLAGVDDPKYRFGRLRQTLGGLNPDEPFILLSHGPGVFEEAADLGVPVMLVGDTHGGQVGLKFLVRMSDYANRTPYIRGHYKRKNTHMYVNRGIGMKTLPIRFLCRPEIAQIRFK